MESLIFEKFYNIKTVETQTQKGENCFTFHGYGLYRNKQMNRHNRHNNHVVISKRLTCHFFI